MGGASWRNAAGLALAALSMGCAPGAETGPQLEPSAVSLSARLVWGPETKLVASDRGGYDDFGTSATFGVGRAVVGAPDNELIRGAAYVYAWDGASWLEEKKLVAEDGQSNTAFGYSVASSGDRVIVGALGNDAVPGAAYVFVRNGTTWTQEEKLTADDGVAGDWFGVSVALTSDRALVGALADDNEQGSAYVFVRDGSTWTQERKLLADDGEANDRFGISVALGADVALVGAFGDDSSTGAAYSFVRTGTTWAQEPKLTASNGGENEEFGYSVSLSNERAVVGARSHAFVTGAAYVYERTGGAWGDEQVLEPNDHPFSANFGDKVSMLGERVLVGAPGESMGAGAAYLFTLGAAGWEQEKHLSASDASENDLFGSSVALGESAALVGAIYADEGLGAAYIKPFDLDPAGGASGAGGTDGAGGAGGAAEGGAGNGDAPGGIGGTVDGGSGGESGDTSDGGRTPPSSAGTAGTSGRPGGSGASGGTKAAGGAAGSGAGQGGGGAGASVSRGATSNTSAGCGCRVTGAGPTNGLGLAAWILIAAFGFVRRRR